jgi:hypothetical protein
VGINALGHRTIDTRYAPGLLLLDDKQQVTASSRTGQVPVNLRLLVIDRTTTLAVGGFASPFDGRVLAAVVGSG